jgi:hypothetical protein
MTVSQLRPEVSLADAVAGARGLVTEAAAVPTGQVGTDDLASAIAGLAGLESQAAARGSPG